MDSQQRVREDDVLCVLDYVPRSLEGSDAINVVNSCGQNLGHFCAQLRYHRCLIALIERGIDIHAKDANGWIPLDFARLHRDEDAMDILEGDWEDSLLNTVPMELWPTDPLPSVKPRCVVTIQTIQPRANLVFMLEIPCPRVKTIRRRIRKSNILNNFV
jgi:hypothetical protein